MRHASQSNSKLVDLHEIFYCVIPCKPYDGLRPVADSQIVGCMYQYRIQKLHQHIYGGIRMSQLVPSKSTVDYHQISTFKIRISVLIMIRISQNN